MRSKNSAQRLSSVYKLGDEEEPVREAEKEWPMWKEENQENVEPWKPAGESILFPLFTLHKLRSPNPLPPFQPWFNFGSWWHLTIQLFLFLKILFSYDLIYPHAPCISNDSFLDSFSGFSYLFAPSGAFPGVLTSPALPSVSFPKWIISPTPMDSTTIYPFMVLKSRSSPVVQVRGVIEKIWWMFK